MMGRGNQLDFLDSQLAGRPRVQEQTALKMAWEKDRRAKGGGRQGFVDGSLEDLFNKADTVGTDSLIGRLNLLLNIHQ